MSDITERSIGSGELDRGLRAWRLAGVVGMTLGYLVIGFVLIQILIAPNSNVARLPVFTPILGGGLVMLGSGYLVGRPPLREWIAARWRIRFLEVEVDRRRLEISERALYSLLFAVAVAAFLGGKYLIFSYDPGQTFFDTGSYVRVAEASLLQHDFWLGERPVAYPFLLKLLGVHQGNYSEPAVIRRVGMIQSAISSLGWLVLSSGVTVWMKSRLLRPIGFAGMLLLGLSLHIGQWDALMLSESLSTSLLVACLGFMLLSVWLRLAGRRRGVWLTGLLLSGLTCTAYALTRDSNSVFLGLLGLGSLLAAGIRYWRRARAPAWLFGVGTFLLLLAILGQGLWGRSGRWYGPFFGQFQQRILERPERRAWFEARGMPLGEWFDELDVRMARRSYFAAVHEDERAEEFVQWVRKSGRGVYARYLLGHPLETLTTPLLNARSMLSPSSTEYRTEGAATPSWLRILTIVFYPLHTGLLIFWILVLSAASTILWLNGRFEVHWLIPAALILSTYPMMLLIWYGDTIEVERHAYQIGLRIRLAAWILTLWLLDTQIHHLWGDRGKARGRSESAGDGR